MNLKISTVKISVITFKKINTFCRKYYFIKNRIYIKHIKLFLVKNKKSFDKVIDQTSTKLRFLKLTCIQIYLSFIVAFTPFRLTLMICSLFKVKFGVRIILLMTFRG